LLILFPVPDGQIWTNASNFCAPRTQPAGNLPGARVLFNIKSCGFVGAHPTTSWLDAVGEDQKKRELESGLAMQDY
jgi:hypothetical protein